MRYLALTCSQCSAPLEVAVDQEQISCAYCGSMLLVSHLHRSAATPDEKPHPHPRQSEINQLDAEWETYRKQSLPTNSLGEYVIPDPSSCLAAMWMTGIIGGIVTVVSFGVRAWPIAGLAVIVSAGIIAVLWKQSKIAPVYERSLRNYQSLRLQLMDDSPV